VPGAESFDPQVVLTKYPFPIARTFEAKLQQSQTPLHRLFGLTDVFEVSLKYCAIIAIQEYLRLGVHSQQVDEEIALHFRIPSLGSWNAFLREILRTFRGQQQQLVIPELVGFYFDSRGQTIARQQQRVDQLINLRNRLAHGARKSDDDADEEFQKHWPLLAALLGDLSFLTEHLLILHDEDGSAHSLMGTQPSPVVLSPGAASDVAPGQLCLVSSDRVLPLSPLLLYARCGYSTGHGPCEVSKIFFFNSAKPRPDFLDYWMAHHRLAADLSERLRNIIERSATHVSIVTPEGASASSWELLQERSEDLVGRVEEELKLLRFIEDRPRGFLIVEGDPGIGKTALLSRTVHDLLAPRSAYGRSEDVGRLATRLHERKLSVAFHLCGADKSSQELPAILSSLANQLPARAVAATNTASDLVNAARATVEKTGGKLLLVVDGVDEALAGRSDAERRAVLDALLLEGERLPSNVFILLGSRRGSIPALRDPDLPTLPVELSGLPSQEIRRLLYRVVSKYDLEDRHVDAIARVSAGNPLYIRMLAEDFLQGRLYLEQVDQLPLGVEAYFEKLLLRFASDAQWPVLRDTLLVLSVAHGPVSAAQVASIAAIPETAVEHAIDYELSALLSQAEGPNRTPVFQLFHAKFREFLSGLFSGANHAVAKRMNEARAGEPAITPADLERARSQMLDYCSKWAALADTYPLRFYSGHLYEAGAHQQLEQLLTGTEFLSEKVRRLDDPFLAAEDVGYLSRVFLQLNRDTDVVGLAARPEGFYRDGVASGLRAAVNVPTARITAIVRQLLQVSPLGAAAGWRKQPLPPGAMNARRVAIEIAFHYGLREEMETAALDRAGAVRVLAGSYLFRFWRKYREAGWKLLDSLSARMLSRSAVEAIESCTVMSLMIMTHHIDDEAVICRLRQPWSRNVARVRKVRLLLRGLLFCMQFALRRVMEEQADFQPVNLAELKASYTSGTIQLPSRKLGVECLEEWEHPERGSERTIQVLLDRNTVFDVFLMQVAERVLFIHGYRDPDRMIASLALIHRDGVTWFHQSTLYTSFHILRNVPAAEDRWLETYRTLTLDTLAEKNAIFETPFGNRYPLLPHMGWAEMIFDQHRPSGNSEFIGHAYREALRQNDIEYARRAIRAAGVLSHSYDRHDLALLALQEAAGSLRPQLRETLVDVLANVRFYDEAAVERFLEHHAAPDLRTRVRSAAPSIRSADTFNWLDTFVNQRIIASDDYRVAIADGYRRAGNSSSLTKGMDAVLGLTLSMIAGQEVVRK
jgi:hypothetical protein